MARFVYLILLVALSQVSDAYKILVVFPLAGKSHNILGQGYVKHLLEAGHEVTYVTPFPTNKETENYHEVDLSDNLKHFDENMFSLKKILDKETSLDFVGFMPQLVNMTRQLLENDKLSSFLDDTTQRFDVVIAEWLYSDIYSAFATVYDCPLIWSSSMEPHWLILSLVHEASNPAYNLDVLSAAMPPFSFTQRLGNLMTQLLIKSLKYIYLTGAEEELYKEFFGPPVVKRGRVLPPYADVVFNGSFILTNSHSSLNQPISVPPNIKEISGYHINPKVKLLPADLQKLIDGAEHGVIYFSMGNNAKSKDFPDVLKQDFLRVFGGLKQTVIWKFEEDLPNRPKNVHIVQWAPQQSILAHPNVKLFITHGGLLSTTESIYFGVPTIVMPYGVDQFLNAVRAVQKGYALKVDLSYEMASEMKIAIEEIVSNSKYKERVQELSKIYHDRLVPPGKELVHWVEHVVRTRGAPHLRSPALMLPWYQKMYLDLAVVVILVLWILKYVLKKLFTKVKSLFSKNSSGSKKKNN